MASKASVFSGAIFTPLPSNQRFARHRLSLILSSRIMSSSAAHTISASSAKLMMLVPLGSFLRLHFLQDVGVGLAVPHRHPDGVTRPGGRGALQLRLVDSSFALFSFFSFFYHFFSLLRDHMPVPFFIWGLAHGHLSEEPPFPLLGVFSRRREGADLFSPFA